MFRGLFGKKPRNVEASIIANRMFDSKVDFTYETIDSFIKETRFKINTDNGSFYKDVEDEYNKLVIEHNKKIKEEDDKRALDEIITRNKIPTRRRQYKEEEDDEWETIEGGMKKRRSKKSRKSKKTRKHRKKRV
jgi:hypothetical protein